MTPDAFLALLAVAKVTHQSPPEGSNIMPCCGWGPWERGGGRARTTLDPEQVTCREWDALLTTVPLLIDLWRAALMVETDPTWATIANFIDGGRSRIGLGTAVSALSTPPPVTASVA